MIKKLQKVKNRGLVLYPPMILWVISTILLHMKNFYNIFDFSFIIPFHFISILMMVIAFVFIHVVDYKYNKKYNDE